MPVTQLPVAPSRADPANFAVRSDSLLAALPIFVNEINALQLSNNNQALAIQLTAAASAAQAATSRDQANAAWAASMAPAETLPAISKTLHSGAIVKTFIYDTGKDSDGGAWRKRCTDKSWYTETLGFTGTWRNQLATTAAAWAVSGAAAGDGFQNTTDGKYYVLTGTTTASEIFRGNVREFPEQVAIIAEASRVIIYDLTQVGCPMWMVFTSNASDVVLCFLVHTASNIASLYASNGKICVGKAGSVAWNGHLRVADFAADSMRKWNGYYNSNYTSLSGISQRNGNIGFVVLTEVGAVVPGIVDGRVNDITATVLDGAPVDPATGLPVPTIAVATAGGVSVIKHDGTVVNSSTTSSITSISFDAEQRIAFTTGGYVARTKKASLLAAAFANNDSPLLINSDSYSPKATNNYLPSPLGTASATSNIGRAAGSASGLAALKLSEKSEQSMAAAITNAYNTGWQVGDIRGAWLADTVAETLTGSGELVTNGTFATNTSGWTATPAGGTISWASGQMTVTGTISTSTRHGAYQAVSCVIGKLYIVQAALISASTVNRYLRVNVSTNTESATTAQLDNALFVVGNNTLSFIATATTYYIHTAVFATGDTITVDNISCKLVEPDRSVKNNGMVVNGSLTKAVVASGANLVSYSGFSASNYLEQPYNSALDFGASDFCVMGWVNLTSVAATQTLLHRSLTGATGGLVISIQAAGLVQVYGTVSTTFTSLLVSTAALAVGVSTLVEVSRLSGTLSIKFNGVTVGSVADATNLTYASAITRIGSLNTAAQALTGSLALVRMGATAPSADQSAHIYRTELPLFQANAQCTIDGTSSGVTALAYDDTTDTLQVGTSWGRSAFRDLLRVESAVSTVGAITSLSANQGSHITGGATSGRYYQPAMLLRDELRRKDEARKALGKVPQFFDFDTISFTSPTTSGSAALTASSVVGTPYVGMGITGTGIPAGTTLIAISGTAYTMSANATVTNAGAVALAQSSFTLQAGYTAKAVYSAEALKREGATKTYTRSSDGFKETINFGTSPGSAAWVSIMGVRL